MNAVNEITNLEGSRIGKIILIV